MSKNGSGADFPLRLADAGKRYVKYEDVPTLIGFAKRFGTRSRRGELWAVRHLDLEVAHGETVGIIGRNGAGKTTTLQMLAGVTAPTEGLVAVHGRVSPLIAVGVGFHQELTGRENVYVNGTVLGMTRREIDRLFDGIVDFAELDRFIDTPVKFYSSGMLVRLGFSVAIAARPDVLLVDEVLAVGDLPFQIKCFERIAEIRASGTSTVVVSHNLNAVRHLCSRVMVIDRGVPRFVGPTAEGISHYLEILDEKESTGSEATAVPVRIISAELVDAWGRPSVHLSGGDEAIFRVQAEILQPVKHPYPVFSLAIHTDSGLLVYQEGTFEGLIDPNGRRYEPGERVGCEVRFRARFPSGTYSAQASVSWSPSDQDVRRSQSVLFYVDGRNPLMFGVADLEASFAVTDASGAIENEMVAAHRRDAVLVSPSTPSVRSVMATQEKASASGSTVALNTPEAGEHPSLPTHTELPAARSKWSVLAFVLAAVTSAGLILWLGRGWSFFYDEWGTILYRRVGGFDAFFAPHNGHLQAVVIAAYRALFPIFGLRHYMPYRVVMVAAHVGCAALIFVYARRRLQPVTALLVTLPILFLGAAFQVLFWPINLGFVLPMLALVGILLLRDRPGRFQDVGTLFLLAVSLASSGLGIAVTAAVGLETLLRSDRWKRLWAVAVPFLGYVLWFLIYRPTTLPPASLRAIPGASPTGDVGLLGYQHGNVRHLPRFLIDIAKAGVNGFLGLGHPRNVIPLAFVVIGLLIALGVRRTWNVRVWALGIALLVFWVLTGIVRAEVNNAQASRYIYPSAVLILLIVIEAFRGLRMPSWKNAILGLAMLAVVASGIHVMHQLGGNALSVFPKEQAKLGALECGPPVSPTFAPDPVFMPGVTAGPYLAAVKALGSPAGRISCAHK